MKVGFESGLLSWIRCLLVFDHHLKEDALEVRSDQTSKLTALEQLLNFMQTTQKSVLVLVAQEKLSEQTV
ncbi:hypothetical protein R1flu_026812 [Riccia fluitans]|uniref:Uncharacterized protein n=1 Tax=Riccia fluitans TaxID=41844 RepID=A0ABD1XH16_9MARC